MRRVQEAARYVALDQICLPGRCGLSSAFEGNAPTRDDQFAKLGLVAGTTRGIWCWPRQSPREPPPGDATIG